MQIVLSLESHLDFWSHGEFQPRVYEWHDTHRVLAETRLKLRLTPYKNA